MTVFWSLAAVMVMVALLFLLPPLLRKRELSAVSRDELNTAVIRTQIADLEADLDAGKLDQAQYGAARLDLEQELLYDLASTGPAQRARSGRWAALLIIPALPLCAVLLYQILGSEEIIDRLQQAQSSQSQPAHSQSPGSIEDMVARLAERMQQQPDDLKGWVMLARSYTILKRYGDAEVAYANVLRLGGGENADLLCDYADAMVMANSGRFTGQAGALLTRALELEPDNIKGLWLAGHWKNQSGDYAEAISYWQQAAVKLPPGSEDAAVIAGQISKVQAQLGIDAPAVPAVAAATTAAAPATTAATGTTASASGATLSVQVTLSPELAAAASAEDTVFIFARATQGPRMPLAIVRKQVKDLPVTVTLDDSQAMMPAMKLSNFEQVDIGARISKSGNAMPESGDLQGIVSPVATQTDETIQITIDSSVP
jgi:cytochrome c-type biogenesis protein CcmH